MADLTIVYKGKESEVSQLSPDRYYFLRLKQFKGPAFPRVKGKDVAERVSQLAGDNPRVWGDSARKIIVEDADLPYLQEVE